MSSGCFGCHSNNRRVRWLKVGMSAPQTWELAEISIRLVGSFAYDRNVQTVSNYAGDVLERHPHFGNGVIANSWTASFESGPVNNSGVKPVHDWLAIRSLTGIRRHSFLA